MSDDITANFHGGNAQSQAAYDSVGATKRRRTARLEILRLAEESGRTGITADETINLLGMTHQSGSARFSELRRDGLLIPIGELRKTRSGEYAEVHVARQYARGFEITAAEHHTRSRRRQSTAARDALIDLEKRLKIKMEDAFRRHQEIIRTPDVVEARHWEGRRHAYAEAVDMLRVAVRNLA